MRNWQVVAVLTALVGAWLIDRTLFGILAAVAVATGVIVWAQSRHGGRAQALAPLAAAVRDALGLDADAGLGPFESAPAGRQTRYELLLVPGHDGAKLACLRVRVAIGASLPLCLAAQRRGAAVELPELVQNVDLFETPLECELEPVVSVPEGALSSYQLAASSPRAVDWLLSHDPLKNAIDALVAGDGAETASFEFDGVALRVLFAPTSTGHDWVPGSIRNAAVTADALGAAVSAPQAGGAS